MEDAGTHLERSQSEQSHLATQNLDNRDTSLFRMTSKSSKSLIPKPDLFQEFTVLRPSYGRELSEEIPYNGDRLADRSGV